MASLRVGDFSKATILFTCLVASACCVEQLVIRHAPDSIKFLSSEPVHSSFLGDIFSAMLAYTVQSNINWHSLSVVPPWRRPEALVVVEGVGLDNKADIPMDGTVFLLENAGDIAGQFDLLSYRTEERFFGKRPVLLHMDLNSELHDSKIVQPQLLKSIPAEPKKRLKLALQDPDIGSLVKDSTFNVSAASDVQLLTEIATAREFLKALRSHKSEVRDAIPDIYWMKIGGVIPIIDTYGTDSLQFREAQRLLRQILSEIETAMRNVYEDNVIVAVMKVNDAPTSHGYSQRKLLQAAATKEKETPENVLNLAYKWDPNFPVTFAIIFFVMISVTLSVFAVSVAMWNMDPGKDSIIYRATTGRMKKD